MVAKIFLLEAFFIFQQLLYTIQIKLCVVLLNDIEYNLYKEKRVL